MSLLIALLGAGCAEWPTEPPPAPRDPPSVDTMSAEAAASVRAATPGNRPPRLTTLSLQPAAPSTLDAVRVTIETDDPDGDRVSVRVRWLLNGQPVPGLDSRSLPPGTARKGQELRVSVTIDDGQAALTEESAAVLIANAPPEFLTRPEELRGDLNGLQLRAADPDGDTLRFELEGGPPGLSVDRKGRLRFEGRPDDPGGRYEATLKVLDSSDDWAGLPLTLTLSPGRPAGAP